MTDYYVSTGGNNAYPGSADKPFKTISRAIQMASNGDTIYVASGVYSEHLVVDTRVTIVGDPDGLVTLDGNGEYPRGTKSFLSALIEVQAINVTIANMDVINSAGNGISSDGYDNVAIDNVNVRNPSRNGIIILDTFNVDITDSEVYGARTKVDLARSDRRGAAIEVRDCQSVVVSGCTVHDNDWQGIGLVECTNSDLFDNTIYDNLGTQIYLDGVDNADVYNNAVFYTTNVRISDRQIGIHLARDIYPLGSGASASSAVPNRQVDIWNNIVVGCSNSLVHRGGFATVYETDDNGEVTERVVEVPGYQWDSIDIYNNTFVMSSKPVILEKERDLFVFGTSGDTECYFVDNIVHTTGKTTLQWREEDMGSYTLGGNLFSSNPPNLKRLKELSTCTGIRIGDPALVNMHRRIDAADDFLANNYKLRPNSPAVGSGQGVRAQNTDYFGNSVPPSGPYTRGFHYWTSGEDEAISADFIIDDTTGDVPHEVQFTDTSTADNSIVKWTWSFGDGEISNERSPRHIYARAGTFTVTLTVTDNKGQTDRKSVPDAITVSFDGVTPTSSNRTRIESAVVQITKTVGVNATQAHNMNYKPDILFITFAQDGSSGGIESAGMNWNVLTSAGTDTSCGMGAYIQAYDEGGPVAAALCELNEDGVRFYDTQAGAYRSINVTWDEDNIYVTEGATAPSYTLYMNIMCLGGPDLEYDMHAIQLTVGEWGEAESSYDSGDIGFSPDLLLAWRDQQPVESGDILTLGYEWHMGYFSKYGDHACSVSGTPAWLNTAWTGVRGKFRSDRMLNLSADSSKAGGIGAEIGTDGFQIWTTQDVSAAIHVLALKFGDLNFHIGSHETVSVLAGGSDVDTDYVLGWEPQVMMAWPTFMSDKSNSTGSNYLANGVYMYDGVIESTHHLYAYTPYTDIGAKRLTQLALYPQGTLNSLTVVAESTFNNDGLTITHKANATYNNQGDKMIPFFLLEDGSIDPITAGFSVSTLTPLTNVPLRVTNKTYEGGISDLTYSYTWTGGGSSTDENPIINFTTTGSKTITLTVTSTSNPNITDTYSVIVNVEDEYVVPKIDVNFGESYSVEAVVGEQVSFEDITIPPSGTSITLRRWSLHSVAGGIPAVIARSSESSFIHVPTEAGRYTASLYIELDDGRKGTVSHSFVADVSTAPVVQIDVNPVAAQAELIPDDEALQMYLKYRPLGASVPGLSYPVPATIRFTDWSSLQGQQLISRQWLISPAINYGRLNIAHYLEYREEPMVHLAGDIWSFSGNQQLDFTFRKPGEYIVTLILHTTGGIGYTSTRTVTVISEQVHALIGPPAPAQVGPQSRSIVDGWGNHSHHVDTTVKGEPSKIVVTDSRGGIHARYFKVTGEPGDDPALRVTGDLDIVGDDAQISGDVVSLNMSALVPQGDAPEAAEIGQKDGKFSVVHAGQVDAGQLAQVGDVNAVGGSVFVGVSYRLLEDIDPEDRELIITNGDNLSNGDYIFLSRENTVEMMRVDSNPVTVRASDDTWRIGVLRGDDVATGYIASAWNRNDVALNLGGSTDDVGDINVTSWLEILADESILSSLTDPGLAEGPVFLGNVRYGTNPTDWLRYFAIGRLEGMYGIPEGTHTVGVALGPHTTGSIFFMADQDAVTINSHDYGVVARFTDEGGFQMYCATGTEAASEESARRRAIEFIHPTDGRTTLSIQQRFDASTRRSNAEIIAPAQPAGWTSGVALKAYGNEGDFVALSLESHLDAKPQIFLVNIPSFDPQQDGAIYYDTVATVGRVLRISSG